MLVGIVVFALLGLEMAVLVVLGIAALVVSRTGTGQESGSRRRVYGALGCAAVVVMVACLVTAGVGGYAVSRAMRTAKQATPAFTPRITPLPAQETATPRPLAGATPDGAGLDPGAALAASLLPGEEDVIGELDKAARYTLAVEVLWDEATISGQQRVLVTNNENVALDTVVLRLYPNAPHFGEGALAVDAVAVNGRPAVTRLEVDDTVLVVELPTPLSPKQQTELSLNFTVSVPERQDRFGVSGEVMALGQWYPMLGVYDDEGWHTDPYVAMGDAFYSETSLFTLTLTVPKGMVVASSGAETNRQDQGDGRETLTFHSAATRDLAVALSPQFKTASAVVDGVTVTSFFLPGDEDGGQQVLDAAARSVQIYNSRYGRYPYANLDMVETHFLIEGSPGGMEYPGLVLLSSVFYDPEGAYSTMDTAEMVVAHEVAHQWWYGVVGNDQVDDPWLDEAMATRASIEYFEVTQGREAAEQQQLWLCTLPYKAVALGGKDRPVATSLLDFQDDALSYSAIVYGKGALFLDELRKLLGDEQYTTFVQDYYAEHKYGIVRPEDFRMAMEAAAGEAKRDKAIRLYRKWVFDDRE